MGTYYRLADRYRLRGWDKLPYALVDSQTGNVAFLTKPMMETYQMCDGSWDFDSPLMSTWRAAHAMSLLEKGRDRHEL